MISVYFEHDKRHPHNVLAAWHGSEVVPRVGDIIWAYDGHDREGGWRVTQVVLFNSGRSATCKVTDASREEAAS